MHRDLCKNYANLIIIRHFVFILVEEEIMREGNFICYQ